MEQLLFSSDGILRVIFLNDKPKLPLYFVKEKSQISELRFMSNWLSKSVLFEDGLTIGTFLECLSPFSLFLDEYLGKNITDYITESKKLVSINNMLDLDWISLYHNYTISELNKTIKNDKCTKIHLINKWKMYDNYSLSGYKKTEQKPYAVSHISLERIKDVPLFLEKESRVIINEKDIELIDKSKKLINENSFAIIKQNIYENDSVSYLLTEREHSLDLVIKGFFEQFEKTIEDRESANSIEIDFLINEEQENIKLVSEENINEEVIENDIQLKINGDVYNNLIQNIEEKSNYWNNLAKTAYSENKIIKIGQICEGVSPEKRFFGLIIEEDIKEIKIK